MRFGASVQPGQIVGISSYVGKEELTRAIAREAYRAGARWVDVLYFDDLVKHERLAHAAEDTLDFIPPWLRDRLLWLSRRARRPRDHLRPAGTRRVRRHRPGPRRPRSPSLAAGAAAW